MTLFGVLVRNKLVFAIQTTDSSATFSLTSMEYKAGDPVHSKKTAISQLLNPRHDLSPMNTQSSSLSSMTAQYSAYPPTEYSSRIYEPQWQQSLDCYSSPDYYASKQPYPPPQSSSHTRLSQTHLLSNTALEYQVPERNSLRLAVQASMQTSPDYRGLYPEEESSPYLLTSPGKHPRSPDTDTDTPKAKKQKDRPSVDPPKCLGSRCLAYFTLIDDPTASTSKRGYNAKKRSEAAQIAAQNGIFLVLLFLTLTSFSSVHAPRFLYKW